MGTVQAMMSEFNYKSDKVYYSDEGTKASSESNATHWSRQRKKNSLEKASEYQRKKSYLKT